MCGISFVCKLDGSRANKSVIKRYEGQRSRGSDGFGYIAIEKNKLVNHRRTTLESSIKEFLKEEKADTILFHHRYPTSTPNLKEAAHPIKVSSINLKYDYYLVHNGIISNADDLKEKHEKLGFTYNTEIVKKWVTSETVYKSSMFNDSEALAVEVAIAIDKHDMKIESRGSIAFIVAQVHKSTNTINAIYFARNTGNPLQIDINKNLISIGSQTGGKNVDVDGMINKLNLKTRKITKLPFEIPKPYETGFRYNSYDGYGGYASTISYKSEQLYDNDDYEYGDDSITETLAFVENEIIELQDQIKEARDNNDYSMHSENNISMLEEELINLYSERNMLNTKFFDALNSGQVEQKKLPLKNKKNE